MMKGWIVVDKNTTMKDFIEDLEVFDSLPKAEKQKEVELGWSRDLTYFDETDIYIQEIEIK